MLHRGPDDGGMTTSGSLTMGMRRLAIFDPAHGAQPMRTPDERFQIVFNGAIFNHRELRHELESVGVSFSTHCDTEVLLKAWAQWGELVLPRLRGMFAFAIWDSREERLVIARDPLGVKPLYFSERGGALLFASELNALRASGHFDAEFDPIAIDDYLRNLGVPVPRTLYRHAQSLRPGELAVWQEGTLAIRRYWQLPQTHPERIADRVEFVAALRAQLDQSIAAHRLADVPVGAFLSGGLDSAVVVGLMSRGSSERLKTFSIGFEETSYSEAVAAQETAEHFGTDHHAITLTGREAAEKLPAFIDSLDQPTGDGINTFVISQAARQGGVTVALSGLGGDELFGGYPLFKQSPQIARWLPWWRQLPKSLRSTICRRLDQGSTRARRLADVIRNSHDLHDVADRQRQVLSDDARRKLLLHPIEPHLHPAHAGLREITENSTPEEIVSAWELNTYMADVLLRDSDVFSMRASLELRVPFVDRPLIEWLWQQNSAFRFDQQTPKGTLVAAVADILPPGLMNRRKQGFTLPFPQWMKGPLSPFLAETLSTESVARTGYLNPIEVGAYWRNFRDGTDDKDWSRVWSLAVLVAFLNRANTG
jgi:asparagine synthase (glutamine-hydrolysing)